MKRVDLKNDVNKSGKKRQGRFGTCPYGNYNHDFHQFMYGKMILHMSVDIVGAGSKPALLLEPALVSPGNVQPAAGDDI
ncbi:MAG: hypothetical protein HZB33_15090 [Nitrospirae bacterium]|nr:hypothetical protein [Nitrospirota bacterium]